MSAIGSSRYGKLEGDERNWLLVFKGVSFAAAPARLRALARLRETRAMDGGSRCMLNRSTHCRAVELDDLVSGEIPVTFHKWTDQRFTRPSSSQRPNSLLEASCMPLCWMGLLRYAASTTSRGI